MTELKLWFKENYLYLTILALLVFVAYAGSLNHAFVADDVPGILNNPEITKTSYIFSNPLTLIKNIIYFTIVNLFGRTPTAFRALNIFLHLGNVWLIFFLLQTLLGNKIALFTAAIFAVHPLATEAVTWVSGGQYARYSFFLLLALVLYVLSDAKEDKKLYPAPFNDWKRCGVYWASMGNFALSLLNSEKAMVFPFILLALEFAYQGLRKNWQRLIFPFVLGGTWALIFVSKIGQRLSDIETATYQSPQTASPLAQIPVAISSYLELIFWPKNLTLYHSEMSFSSVAFYLRLMIFLVFLGLAVLMFKKSKPACFWLSFFIIALFPTLVPFGISWIVAERYAYLGSIGIYTVAAMVVNSIVEGFVKKFGERYQQLGRSLPAIAYGIRRWQAGSNLYVIILIPLILTLTARTITRNQDWKNQDTLWLAAAKTSPSSPQNHNNLGDLYGRRGDLERSAEEFKKAIELKPGYADAYHNLGNTYQQMGKIDEAIVNYQKAAEANPGLWQSCQNLAAIYFEQEEFELAKEWMEKAVAANPENQNLRRNLEVIHLKLENVTGP